MEMKSTNHDYKNQVRVIRIIGVLLLLGGIVIGFLGPLEMYCFYLFSEGGRFYYKGFGFGSFMFGNIASQIIGYYLIATIFITLGYGHLKTRRWVRKISLSLLWSWLVVGAPLVLIIFLILIGTKKLSSLVAVLSLVFLGLSYLVFPWMFIRFYSSPKNRQYFDTEDTKFYWTDNVPTPILVLSILHIFYIVMLHVLILFKGAFPLFGVFVTGLRGIFLLDISIVCLVSLIWGVLHQQLWAWWGTVIFFGLFTFSAILSFLRNSYLELLSILAFPPREIEFLEAMPIESYHLSLLVGIPLIITWIVAVLSKRYYKRVK